MWSILLVPNKLVGRAHITNINASEPTMAGKCNTKSISICVTQWTTWFQLHANGTTGVHHPNTQKTRPQIIISTPLYQWFITGNI